MIRSLVLGAALAASTLDAQALERRFDWTFSGFISEDGGFQGNDTLSGYFVVEHASGAGSYDKSALREFWVEGINFAACPLLAATHCSFSDFSYVIGGDLHFKTFIGAVYPLSHWNFSVATGDEWSRSSYPLGSEPFYSINRWSDDTQFSIVATPAPEPHTYLMMGVGLAALLGAARRRRRDAGAAA